MSLPPASARTDEGSARAVVWELANDDEMRDADSTVSGGPELQDSPFSELGARGEVGNGGKDSIHAWVRGCSALSSGTGSALRKS
jgi:hypothetical protein